MHLFAQRTVLNFNKDWKFFLGDDSTAKQSQYNDVKWRVLNVPHDWSIEGTFSEKNPTTHNQGALPAGIAWYRKTFTVPISLKDKKVYINFDGIHRNSEVWINGHYLGKRPYGYSSFCYELTSYLKFGTTPNVLAVRVDDSAQPTSRWYTGSGIYRKVWLLTTNNIAVDQWGVFVTTPKVNTQSATVSIKTTILNHTGQAQKITIQNIIYNAAGKTVATKTASNQLLKDSLSTIADAITITNPVLWSVEKPYLYKAKTIVRSGNTVLDEYETPFGIRSFRFDAAKGFFLNDKPLKILGVCNHHDLGALGAAVNTRAIERQLEILKAMGCNGIRTAHNP
ncbi:MAG: beta galactosidase jelly roll domain-containing protein, partial [Flavisolibacter sp.]|nr:beta galactosidase jelly roll domain-containing protein [Flavisolibacter sp.]